LGNFNVTILKAITVEEKASVQTISVIAPV
jgi:hypothetical protein